MKKIFVIIGIIVLLMTGCNRYNFNSIMQKIELGDYHCKIEKESDTHGGFLGDGDYFARIKCSDIDYDKLSKSWKELPLTSPLIRIMDMKQCYDRGCNNVYAKYNIPNITNGYYYFYDRHTDATNRYDETMINDRSSYNFNLALLDKDTNIIYYYALDT